MSTKKNYSKNSKCLNNSFEIMLGNISDLEYIYPLFNDDFQSEEKDYSYLEKLMVGNKYKLFIAKETNLKKIIGYSFILEEHIENVLWLDYIAIDKKSRGLGYGTYFMKEIKKYYTKDFLGFVIELQQPTIDKSESALAYNKKLSFYKKFNAYNLNLSDITQTANEDVVMDLFFVPLKVYENIIFSKVKAIVKNIDKYFLDYS